MKLTFVFIRFSASAMTVILKIQDHPHRADLVEAWLQLRTALWTEASEQEHLARVLLDAVRDWAREQGCTELASDLRRLL
ncbi:hypothetical protein [Achromobacter piechaudii]|uniref:Uncharacterized protein n=1 Tax=Achromobacter piechaudii ATCC 43553 TaxID=742159 RepID=D4XCH7_9BURK|nr:hypothetical protein [Achromobacter piechaudii]EFF75488.1 hypothetical protein HMPREF0004_3174 [Achromobacter piechaudii ATCC 43553]